MADETFLFVREVGKNIQAARELRGMVQQELADLCELSKSAIVKIERGESFPSSVTLAKVAQALKTPVGTLLQVSGPRGEKSEFDDRDILRNILAVFQYQLESSNFIRKSPESVAAFAQTRNDAESRAYIAAMALRLAQLQGYEFVFDQNYRAAFGVKLEQVLNQFLQEAETQYKSLRSKKKK